MRFLRFWSRWVGPGYTIMAAGILGLVLTSGCGSQSTHPTHPQPVLTATPEPSPSLQEFNNYAAWMNAYPNGCAATMRTLGALLRQENDGGQQAHWGMRYVNEIDRDCRAKRYTDVQTAADLLQSWVQTNQ